MTLLEVVKNLKKYDTGATIYASKPWHAGSRAVIALESEESPATVLAENMSYFLEVFIAIEFLEDWEATLGSLPTLQDRCARLIQYAINDA